MDQTGIPSREGELLKGKYLLQERLGIGGMGDVYRARNTLLDRIVAIKLLRADLVKSKLVVQRFTREARAANVVRHRNIVDVLDIDEDDNGILFIVQEYLDGEDLGIIIERSDGSMPAAEALDILIPVAEAVGVAHEKGLVHRDLKPENIFLAHVDDQIVPKILDFGISKISAEPEEREKLSGSEGSSDNVRLTAAGTAMGTPAYMSPEQIRDPASVDARTDVWAIGVMLYETVSGRLPFEAETLDDLFAEICIREPPPLHRIAPDAPAELAKIVRRCLRPEATARYVDAVYLGKALKRCRQQIAEGVLSPGQVLSSIPADLSSPPPDSVEPSESAPPWTVPPDERFSAPDPELDSAKTSGGQYSSIPSRRDSVEPGRWQLDLSSSQPPPSDREEKISSPRPISSGPPPPIGPTIPHDGDTFELDEGEPEGIELDDHPMGPPHSSDHGALRAARTAPRSVPPITPGSPSRRSRIVLSRTSESVSNAPEVIRLVLAAMLTIAVVLLAPKLSPHGLAAAEERLAAQAFLAYGGAALVLLVAGLWTMGRAAKMVSLFLFIASLALLVLTLGCGVSGVVLTAPGLVGSTMRMFVFVAAPWSVMVVPAGYGLFAVSRARELRGDGGSRRVLAAVLVACCVSGVGLIAWSYRTPRPTIDDIAKMSLVPAEARTVHQIRRFTVTIIGARAVASESTATATTCVVRPSHHGTTVPAAVATPSSKK